MGSKSYMPVWVPSFSIKSPSSPGFKQLLAILRSCIPILLFLAVYGINKWVHIQPLLEDLGYVHVHTINNLEGFLLGCHPHKLVSSLHYPVLDALSAIPYLIHYVIPVLCPLYFYLAGRTDEIPRFYWLMGWVNWLIYFIWLVFPHAPPWVIDHMNASGNGTEFSHAMLHGEGCAFHRLDQSSGHAFFYNMLSGSPIPYGSFPSGHVAWPFVFFLQGGPGGNWFILYVFYMSWATLYTCHHYLTDSIGALILVLVTRKLVNYLQEKQVCGVDYRCRPTSCPLPV